MSSNFLRLLDQRGEGKASEATIVNLTSGWYPLPAMSAYLGSKMQVARLTECLEVERGEEGLVSYGELFLDFGEKKDGREEALMMW